MKYSHNGKTSAFIDQTIDKIYVAESPIMAGSDIALKYEHDEIELGTLWMSRSEAKKLGSLLLTLSRDDQVEDAKFFLNGNEIEYGKVMKEERPAPNPMAVFDPC